MHNFDKRLERLRNWSAPAEWLKITAIDAHTGGEPLRIITGGLPELQGATVLERRRFMRDNFDHLRTALMWEPRGHADQYGAVVMPPCSEDADFSVLFLHNEGYSTMCGHAIIALTKVMLETGAFAMSCPVTELRIEVPAGLIHAFADCEDGRVNRVRFHNVPSFVSMLDRQVNVPGLGTIHFDLAFGGAFYAYVNARECGVKMVAEDYRNLIETGMAIKHAVRENFEILHPFEDDLSFLYGTIFMGPGQGEGSDSRNVCIFAEGEVDRSPTGSGVAGRMAIHYARGEVGIGQKLRVESILGSVFVGSVIAEASLGPYKAVIPQVEGYAHVNGTSEFIIDPSDSLRNGFILR
jgi:proline racemase